MGEALGRSQGGFSTKLHLLAEGGGKPITAVLTAGERHEQFALDALMDKGWCRAQGEAARACVPAGRQVIGAIPVRRPVAASGGGSNPSSRPARTNRASPTSTRPHTASATRSTG